MGTHTKGDCEEAMRKLEWIHDDRTYSYKLVEVLYEVTDNVIHEVAKKHKEDFKALLKKQLQAQYPDDLIPLYPEV